MRSLESFIKEAISTYDLPKDTATYREIKGTLVRAGFSDGIPQGSYSSALDIILSGIHQTPKMAKVASVLASPRQHCPRCNGVMTSVCLHQGSAIHCPSCNVVVPL